MAIQTFTQTGQLLNVTFKLTAWPTFIMSHIYRCLVQYRTAHHANVFEGVSFITVHTSSVKMMPQACLR